MAEQKQNNAKRLTEISFSKEVLVFDKKIFDLVLVWFFGLAFLLIILPELLEYELKPGFFLAIAIFSFIPLWFYWRRLFFKKLEFIKERYPEDFRNLFGNVQVSELVGPISAKPKFILAGWKLFMETARYGYNPGTWDGKVAGELFKSLLLKIAIGFIALFAIWFVVGFIKHSSL